MTEMLEWVTGPSVSREDLAQYTHLICHPEDPERSPRPEEGGRRDKFPHRTLAKLPPSGIRSLLLGGLADGTPRTFNRLGVELFDMTADVMFTTPVNDVLWELVEAGEIEHTLTAPILFRRTKEARMEDQDQDQNQNQEGEELLKMLEAEEGKEGVPEPEPAPAPSASLLSLTEISRQTGIMYVTLKRYAVLHDTTDLAGMWEGEGRNKKYYPEAVEVFRRLKAESKKGRPPGPGGGTGTPGRGGVVDPLPPSISPGKKSTGVRRKKGQVQGKKGAVKRSVKPAPARAERSALPSASIPPSLSTQEADRAMAAIERVQLMARYEAVKEMAAPLVKEMERLEKVLGLGEAMR